MRMTWARRKASPSASVDRVQFVMWDFLKMFLAAVICGIVVSLAAAGIAVVLSQDANAASFNNVDSTSHRQHAQATAADAESPAFPGVLVIGSGCDADLLDAIESDWKVTIGGNNIDVRVMQTFIVPPGDAMAATFNAALPVGARLLRLNVHTNGGFWQGKMMDAKKVAQLTAVDFRQYSRRGMLIVQNDDGVISTDAIINIAAAEAVTIEYTYRTITDETRAPQNLFVALASETTAISPEAVSRTPDVSIWVEWIGGYPSRLTQLPGGAFLETADTKITGLSWTSGQRNNDTQFRLAWSM